MNVTLGDFLMKLGDWTFPLNSEKKKISACVWRDIISISSLREYRRAILEVASKQLVSLVSLLLKFKF